MHLALKKDTKNSITLAILVEFLVNSFFHESKIPIHAYSKFRFFLEKNEISKFHEEWKM
jgi:hypothetical protein